MKNMKNLIVVFLYIITGFGCVAQSNIPSNAKEILMSKTWIIDGVEDHTYKIIFTNTKMITYSNEIIVGEDEYYLVDDLSQCGPNKFIQSNVGNSNSGKYFVAKGFCLEFTNISNNKLEFKNLKLNSNMSATPE